MANLDFQRDVLDESKRTPVLVDFWAAWCAPCRTLGPVLERLAARHPDRFKLVKINTDEQAEVAARYRISSIPAVKLFDDGEVLSEFVGALPEPEVERWLDANLPSAGRRLVSAALARAAAGNKVEAERLLEEAIRAEPALPEARVRLAELRFRADPDAALALVQPISANDPLADGVESLRTLARLLDLAHRDAPAPPGARADLWQRYLEGARAFASGRDAEAFDAWIDVLRRNRSLDDDGPRRACVALFHLLGDDSEVTREYRRAFSSALY